MAEPASKLTSWSLRDLKGTRQDLIEQVQAAAFVPETAKADIIAKLEAFPAEMKYLRLDCHVQVVATPRGPHENMSRTISAL